MTFRAIPIGSVVLSLLSPLTSTAEIVPNTTYRLVPSTVYESRPVTRYHVQDETIVEQQPVTTYRLESVTEMRQRKYRVAKPVVETSERVQRYKVMRPVTETSYREETVDRTTYETETRWREERRTVQKPLVETSEREERRTVLRPVTEYSYKEESYTSYRPETRLETQWRDASGYVDVPALSPPGPVRNRLRWLPRTAYQNPQTGLPTSQRAGFYWVPEQRPGVVVTQRQFVPSYVPETVEQTSWVPEQVTRRVPVEQTRYEEEVQVRKMPVQTYRTVTEEQYRYVPEVVRKPITTTYTRKVPVTRTRWEEQEVVRKAPVKTYRVEYEDRVEEYPVVVQRSVPVQQMLQRERTVRRYVPYETEQLIPKTVMLREPIADDCQIVVERPVELGASVQPYSIARPTLRDETITYSPWSAVSSAPAIVPDSDVPADIAPTLKDADADADPSEEPDKPLHQQDE